jgi:cytochrome c-type biogenesis protein CcmH/NrfG
MGQAALNEGRPHEAVAAFESALSREPGHADAWRQLGEAHAELENDPAAISCFKRAVAEDPFNTDALLALGVSLLNERQRQDALVVLQAWLEHNERFAGHDLQALAAAESPGASQSSAPPPSLVAEQAVDRQQQAHIMKVSVHPPFTPPRITTHQLCRCC